MIEADQRLLVKRKVGAPEACGVLLVERELAKRKVTEACPGRHGWPDSVDQQQRITSWRAQESCLQMTLTYNRARPRGKRPQTR